jgi:hypothetical protein
MSATEMFAASVFNRAIDIPGYGFDEEPVEWAGERLHRAGLPLRVTNPPSAAEALDGLPDLSSEWLGAPATVRVVDHPDFFRALVIAVSQAEVYRHVVRDGPAYQLQAAREFRDLCDATGPTYAFVQTAPVEDVPEFLEDVATGLLGSYVPSLVGFGFPLWYVDKAWANDVPGGGPVRVAEELPARDGVVVLGRDSLARWL